MVIAVAMLLNYNYHLKLKNECIKPKNSYYYITQNSNMLLRLRKFFFKTLNLIFI